MRVVTLALALALATTPLIAAKGSGGHGGGGHASGGHASGGHVATGHATARSSGGHAAAGHATGRSSAGRAVVGTAVRRTAPPPRFIASSPTPFAPLITRPYLVRPNFLGFGFGGLGSFYVPYGSWYDDPFYSYYSYPYAGGTVLGGGAPAYAPMPFAFDDDDTGGVRLQVDQRDAAVYVDGYYAGVVDYFDGHFQHLDLTPGPHHIQIEQAGYAPLSFDINIQAHRKIDYRATMAPVTQ